MAATIRFDTALAADMNVSPEPNSAEEMELIQDSVAQTRRRLGHPEF